MTGGARQKQRQELLKLVEKGKARRRVGRKAGKSKKNVNDIAPISRRGKREKAGPVGTSPEGMVSKTRKKKKTETGRPGRKMH